MVLRALDPKGESSTTLLVVRVLEEYGRYALDPSLVDFSSDSLLATAEVLIPCPDENCFDGVVGPSDNADFDFKLELLSLPPDTAAAVEAGGGERK